MKHLLNDLSQEEKTRILEQHNGGMSIDTSKFKKLLVKEFILVDPEPKETSKLDKIIVF